LLNFKLNNRREQIIKYLLSCFNIYFIINNIITNYHYENHNTNRLRVKVAPTATMTISVRRKQNSIISFS